MTDETRYVQFDYNYGSSAKFALAGDIGIEVAPTYAESLRFGGQESRFDRLDVSALSLHTISGLGTRRVSSAPPTNGTLGVWKSTSETYFPRQITPALLRQNATGEVSGFHIRGYADFLGSLWSMWEEDNANAPAPGTYTLEARRFAPDAWTGGGSIVSMVNGAGESYSLRGRGLASDGTYLIAAYVRGNPGTAQSFATGDAKFAYSTDGVTWNEVAATIGANYAIIDAGNNNYYSDNTDIVYDSVNRRFYIAYSTNTTVTSIQYFTAGAWLLTSIGTVTSLAGTGVGKLLFYRDLAGARAPVVCNSLGVWAYNGTAWTLLHDMGGEANQFNGRNATVFNDSLYVPTAAGSVLKITVGTDGTKVVTRIGPNDSYLDASGALTDGIPVEWQGRASCLIPFEKTLLGAFGGLDASHTAVLLKYDDVASRWHFHAEASAANIVIPLLALSSNNDSVYRTHYFEEGTTTSVSKFIENVLSNPLTLSSCDWETSSYLVLPTVTGGMADTYSLWLYATHNAYYANSSDHIDLLWRLNQLDSNRTKGDGLSGVPVDAVTPLSVTISDQFTSTRNLLYLYDRYGTLAYVLGPQLTLTKTGASTQAIALFEFNLYYTKINVLGNTYRKKLIIPIDIDQTVKTGGPGTTRKSVRTALAAVLANYTALQVTIDGVVHGVMPTSPTQSQIDKLIDQGGEWNGGIVVLNFTQVM